MFDEFKKKNEDLENKLNLLKKGNDCLIVKSYVFDVSFGTEGLFFCFD